MIGVRTLESGRELVVEGETVFETLLVVDVADGEDDSVVEVV